MALRENEKISRRHSRASKPESSFIPAALAYGFFLLPPPRRQTSAPTLWEHHDKAAASSTLVSDQPSLLWVSTLVVSLSPARIRTLVVRRCTELHRNHGRLFLSRVYRIRCITVQFRAAQIRGGSY